MESDEKIVRVESLDDFDRELARDGGEALEVPASLAEQYGLFPEDVGTEDEIRDASAGSARPRGGSRPMKHDEYHRQFAEGIIEQIRQGTAPWQKPWGPGERVLPANVDTGRSYSGGNSLHLAAVQQVRGYGDVRWGTYRQIQARDGQVRKGEQGTRILSFQDHRKISVTDERGRPVRDNEGKRVHRHERLPTPSRPAVHRVQRRADRRAAGPARAHYGAALEGAPERRDGARGQRGLRPSRGRRPRVLLAE